MKRKLPADWEIYSNANRKPPKPPKRRGIARWKYAVWAFVIALLAVIAFFPWQIAGHL